MSNILFVYGPVVQIPCFPTNFSSWRFLGILSFAVICIVLFFWQSLKCNLWVFQQFTCLLLLVLCVFYLCPLSFIRRLMNRSLVKLCFLMNIPQKQGSSNLFLVSIKVPIITKNIPHHDLHYLPTWCNLQPPVVLLIWFENLTFEKK